MLKLSRKIVAYVLTVALVLGTVEYSNGSIKGKTKKAVTKMEEVLASISEQDDETGIDYIILTNEKGSLEEKLETAVLTKEVAGELREKYDDVIIEEDFLLEATAVGKSGITDKKKFYKKLEKRKKEIKKEENRSEWNIQAIDAEEVNVNIKDNVKVAVLDSGVDYISGVEVSERVNFVEEENHIVPIHQDMTGHGTGIAGIIASDGEIGVQGVNPDVELYSVKVLDRDNKAPVSRIIKGIYWCIEHNINIINMSFGTDKYSPALEKAVKEAYHANILMIGAAGNDAGRVEYPAAFDEVMAAANSNK